MNYNRALLRNYANIGCVDNPECGCGIGDVAKVQDTELALSAAGAASTVGLAIAGATAAIPFVGPIVAGASLLVGSLFKPDINKINGANAVNQLTEMAQQNLDSWNNLPASGRTKSVQQYYINNFQQIFAALQQACQNSGVTDKTWVSNCVADRQSGGKYSWDPFINPIVNAAGVIDDSPLSTMTSDITSGNVSDLITTAKTHPLLAIGVAVGLALLVNEAL